MKLIPITNNQHVLVDDADYAWLSQWEWYREGAGYAQAKIDGKLIRMHRLIANPPPGFMTDHINGNKLDNRRDNLRICTPSENARNRSGWSNKTSKYCGVHRFRSGRWVAQITYNRKCTHLGYFATEIEAAKAYDAAARARFGEFARLNFPEEPVC